MYFQIPVNKLKEYSIGITGKQAVIEPWLKEREVFHTQDTGIDNRYAVVKNDFTENEKEQMLQQGIRFSAVSASDPCVYVTNDSRKKGGDDVFERSSNS